MNLRVFLRHESATSFESFALAMSVIAVLFVAAADLLHYASKKDGMLAQWLGSEQAQFARAGSGQPVRGDIDYTATGSIIDLRHLPTLDPCTGAAK